MNYEEKKSLYERIMMDVAKSVKKQINEAGIASPKPLSDKHLLELAKGIPLENLYNPGKNDKFYARFPNDVILKNGKIGFVIKCYNEDDEYVKRYTFLRDTLGKAFEDYFVIGVSALLNPKLCYFDFRLNKVLNTLYKGYLKKLPENKMNILRDRVDQYCKKVVQNTDNPDDIINNITKINFEPLF